MTDTFSRRFARQLKRPTPQLAAEVLELLRAYPWPGNVRELQNAIEHALVLRCVNGKKAAAAKLLGIHRATICHKLRLFGIPA